MSIRDAIDSARSDDGSYLPRPTLDTSKLYSRIEPQGDAGDLVRVVGAWPKFHGGEFIEVRLIVESATFGAVPDAWDHARVEYPVADFEAEYIYADPAEIATHAAEQAIARKEASAASADRVSPWAYALPAARRTSKGGGR